MADPSRPPLDIDGMFTYRPPTEEQLVRAGRIREQARVLAHSIEANTRPGPDQTAAIRQLRETVATAIGAIGMEITQ